MTQIDDNGRTMRLLRQMWLAQCDRGDKPAPVWALIDDESGALVAWSVSRAGALKQARGSTFACHLARVYPDIL